MWTFLLLASAFAFDGDVVVLGNSYTFVNDLPTALQATLRQGDHNGSVASLTAGGLKLPDHLARVEGADAQWQWAFDGDHWDVVILQDQSQVPGFPDSSPDKAASLSAVSDLDVHAQDADATTMLFLTWGRRDGDAGNSALYPDYETMQTRLDEGYTAYRDRITTAERPAYIAPVGPAFRLVHDDEAVPLATNSAFYTLYGSDGSHPSPAGTLLAASVFYASLTGCDPTGLPTDLVDDDTAAHLQTIAKRVVIDGEDGGLNLTYPWEDAPCGVSPDDPAETEPPPDTDPPEGCGCASTTGAAWIALGLPMWFRRRRATRA